ncbi:MAG TPA: tetratricopeptide repeat protein [Bacteroidales bacterium]|jgi:tetratricopeptide (TPR) repeat protein|nr:tetratricopeptide repeat protein [Bacteroidales bacterium]MDD3891859.1 tetratricopeptide repeat protein [Bacteroidales bacterium]HCX99191.1 tetratricopeptide repeat protein [Bacteroidales bacterium]
MAKSKKQVQDTGAESLENALTRTEQYIENNQKSLTIIVLAIIVIVGTFLGYRKLYIAPMEEEAQSQIFAAEQYFERDSFNLALYGDGNYLGFVDIIDSYSPTKVGNLARYYAGISYRELGEYEEAIDNLKRFSPKDKMIGSVAYGAIADCYVELGKLNEAAKQYVKAANYGANNFSTPIMLMKAGMVYEEIEKYAEALKVYETIKADYPKSSEAREIEKYITRAKLSL